MSQSQFVTYAQNGEDVLLWRALKGVQRGCYVDVGAQDPVDFSVTKAFYERGWHGINIEPVNHWYHRLMTDRPHDVNLQVAVSDRAGDMKLFEIENTGLSTSNPQFAERHRAQGFLVHESDVTCMTLDSIFEEHRVETVHFLKLDCEGAEKQVLQGASLARVRPWVVLVEATEPLSTKPTWQQWEPLLTDRGYQFVFFDGLNRYYLADEHMELMPAFGAPVNVFDDVQRISDIDAHKQIESLQGEVEGLKSAATVAKLQAELATVTAERDQVTVERDASQREAWICRDEARRLQESQKALLSSHSWRITAPLRSCSRVFRWSYRRLRRMIYLVLRPFAHMARPALQRLVENDRVRRVAMRVFGEHSRITESSRLFLFGAIAPTHIAGYARRRPVGRFDKHQQEARSLRPDSEDPYVRERAGAVYSGGIDVDGVMDRVRAEVMRSGHR